MKYTECEKIVQDMLKFVEYARKNPYSESTDRLARVEYLMGMNIKLWELFFEIKKEKEK
jgi:hypothetical protein